MHSHATPETFKPGERWLVEGFGESAPLEVTCLEWAPSERFVKLQYGMSEAECWRQPPILIERLPNESEIDKAAEPARTVEDDSFSSHFRAFLFLWPCICDHCQEQKEKIKVSHDFAIKTIENAAQSNDHRID